jgi:hypothetical protein
MADVSQFEERALAAEKQLEVLQKKVAELEAVSVATAENSTNFCSES